MWSEKVTIPTYGVGMPDRNPMFLEKRVYQGSSGKVYPLPVIDRITDEKEDREYDAVFLENDYLRVMVLPELGGRVQRATDKTNGYDFVYYNEVIKPALVGLAGPWISGGIEFNWPQHHRPTTFSPVDYYISNGDGLSFVEMSEVDQMYGTRGTMRITLYTGRAYIEISGRLYNRTPFPQTFLWWANPAVSVNNDTVSVFPPDVSAVFDHGKRDVSSFPIATGVYYKHDYGAGVDISRYRNIPVPTSYMCAKSDYDFVGGYDFGREAGIMHVADHHISPGKKQWTWGCGDFGRSWDRNLTDSNGPYIELMTGVFCDNQPDFSWLDPFEEKEFTQYFMPYKKAGRIKCADENVLMNLEFKGNNVYTAVYSPIVLKRAEIVLKKRGEDPVFDEYYDLSPDSVFEREDPASGDASDYTLTVFGQGGKQLLTYRPPKETVPEMPEPAEAVPEPEKIATNEELWLAGRHLEQYRHAIFAPDPYYLEALKRDPGDIRANNAYGLLLMKRGQFELSERFFLAAIRRMTKLNPNPRDSEAFLFYGLSLMYRGRYEKAYDAFYKAAWSAPQQHQAFYCLAEIDCIRHDYPTALDHIEKSVSLNARSAAPRVLRARIARSLGMDGKASELLSENIRDDAFDYASRIMAGDRGTAAAMMGNRTSSYIECALIFSGAGYYEDALDILSMCPADDPILYYHIAHIKSMTGQDPAEDIAKAESLSPYCVFPNRLEDMTALLFACAASPNVPRAHYYLGCLLYDRRRYEDALDHWEKSSLLDPGFPTVFRNLAVGYFNKRHDPCAAETALERAFALDPSDARVLLELDQLRRKLGWDPERRIEFLEQNRNLVLQRDDLAAEYCRLLNTLGRYEDALMILGCRRFHPWEGGEGKVTSQYIQALRGLAVSEIENGRPAYAAELLGRALNFPDNLGEGKLEGEKDNDIYYLLGISERMAGLADKAEEHLSLAAAGNEEPSSALYYNDQPADMILYEGLAQAALGNGDAARSRFHKLISYGRKHYYDEVTMDYFAVSLPDLQLFEDDLSKLNRIHCDYLMGLGYLGLGQKEKAAEYLNAVLEGDPSHQGARVHLGMLEIAATEKKNE